MPPLITQNECCVRFLDLLRQTIDRVDVIDKLTPATPETKPDWWCEMMDLQRTARGLLAKLEPDHG